MKKLLVSASFLATASVIACSFQVGTDPKTPTAPAKSTPAAVPTPAPQVKGTPVTRFGKKRLPPGATAITPSTPTAPASTAAPTTTTPPVTPPPGGVPIMSAANAFGSGTVDPAGFKGSVYMIPAGTTKLPDLASMAASGYLFTKTLDVSAKAMQGGFPGIDPARNENFAIRFEAPLVVDNEADYNLRIVSDDGSVVFIDGTVIVDNDGVNAHEKSGPVHLVKGTHMLTVDYFQTTGNVALQFYCSRTGMAETICPTHL